MSASLGGRSLHYAQQIKSAFIPFGAGNWAIYADREVTLNESLSSIDERWLRYFRLIWNDGEVMLTREHATWLRDALNDALTATAGDAEVER